MRLECASWKALERGSKIPLILCFWGGAPRIDLLGSGVWLARGDWLSTGEVFAELASDAFKIAREDCENTGVVFVDTDFEAVTESV